MVVLTCGLQSKQDEVAKEVVMEGQELQVELGQGKTRWRTYDHL